MPRCLTIASSDSGGGAGIQADLRAFAAAGCHGMSAIVAVTAQSTTEVRCVHEVPVDVVIAQCECVLEDIGADAVKTGLLPSPAAVEAVARLLEGRRLPLVVDPVLAASSGRRLVAEGTLEAIRACLLPLATVVTPNLAEARELAGDGVHQGGAGGPRDLAGVGGSPERAQGRSRSRAALAERIRMLGPGAVVITGGHGDEPWDHLHDGRDGGRHLRIEIERREAVATHGSGCTHSATLAARLARGEDVVSAARGAAAAAAAAIGRGLAELGSGEGPVDVLDIRRLGAAR